MLRIDRSDGGPAFPIETTSTPYAPGMSLRDWFAGQALAGNIGNLWASHSDDAAKRCYELADAMLAERNK